MSRMKTLFDVSGMLLPIPYSVVLNTCFCYDDVQSGCVSFITHAQETMNISCFTAGGTIDKIYFDRKNDYQVGDSIINQILRDANVTFTFSVQPVIKKDSLDITPADRSLLFDTVSECPDRHILITHGTDTMIETAKFLLPIPDKTIVLTGSMQPARFRNSDAVFNIGFALAAVQILPPGVHIAMNGRIFNPDRAEKNIDLNRFESIESS